MLNRRAQSLPKRPHSGIRAPNRHSRGNRIGRGSHIRSDGVIDSNAPSISVTHQSAYPPKAPFFRALSLKRKTLHETALYLEGIHPDRAPRRHRHHRHPRCNAASSLQSAREKARAISCMNSQRQLGLASITYATDNDGHFPKPPCQAATPSEQFSCYAWTMKQSYMADLQYGTLWNYVQNENVWMCPSDKGEVRSRPGMRNFSYSLNDEMSYDACGPRDAPPVHGQKTVWPS